MPSRGCSAPPPTRALRGRPSLRKGGRKRESERSPGGVEVGARGRQGPRSLREARGSSGVLGRIARGLEPGPLDRSAFR